MKRTPGKGSSSLETYTPAPLAQRAVGKRTRSQARYSAGSGNPALAAEQAEALLAGRPGAGARGGSLPRGGGAQVDRGLAGDVERATGQPLGEVSVHSDAESAAAADELGARAFTVGQDIYLGSGESSGDRQLMAHEAAHTLQQAGAGGAAAQAKLEVSRPGDALESEADQVAAAALSGGRAQVSVGAVAGAVQRDVVSDIEDKLSYGAFDWAVTDSEATEALALLAPMPMATLKATLGKLGDTYKNRLLDNLPASAKQTSGYTKVLVALGPGGVLGYVRDLLSYGAFDWAVTDSDAAEVFQIFRALPPADQATLTTSLGAKFRGRLAGNLQRISAVGPEEFALLRVLFDNTPEAEIPTLQRWVATRFNLKVGASTDSNGVAWDKRGLRRCWDVLEMLPAAHVENNGDLSSLTRYRSGSIEGWASSSGEAAIGYGDANDINSQNEVGDFTDAGDPLRGTNMFDATVRHEIGHRVDAKVGGPAYTASASGGEWLTWDGVDGMADRMATASGGKIASWPDAAEKRTILATLQQLIADRKPEEIDARLEAMPFVANHATDPAQAAKLGDIKGDSSVLCLSQCFSHQAPWSKATGGIPLGDRVYQESYAWPQWVSYKAAARAKKVSQYQFRAPGEWFAEAYAAYYQPPGAKGALLVGLDDPTKAWFDANVDPQGGAGGTTPAPAGAAGGGAGGP